jgi:hypothetical protein
VLAVTQSTILWILVGLVAFIVLLKIVDRRT